MGPIIRVAASLALGAYNVKDGKINLANVKNKAKIAIIAKTSMFFAWGLEKATNIRPQG